MDNGATGTSGLRQYPLERLDLHLGVDAGRDVRVVVGPALRGFERFELGHDQAAAEAGLARIVAVDGRMRPGEHESAFVFQRFQARMRMGP